MQEREGRCSGRWERVGRGHEGLSVSPYEIKARFSSSAIDLGSVMTVPLSERRDEMP